MPVPLLDLTRENLPLLDEINAAMRPLFEKSQFILGQAVDDFEKQLASYFSTIPEKVIAVSSGTDAQLLALMALEAKPNSEVITTPFTFFATAGVIHRAGLRPRFVDIDPKTFNIRPDLANEAVNTQTVAMMPVHLYGQAADLDPMLQHCRERGLALIEDAAQAMGARYKNKMVGAIGTMGEISFFPTKNLGAFGDAGLLLVNDDTYVAKSRRLRVHGMKDRYEHLEVGGNFRIDAIQAAILSVKLPHLNGWHEARRKNAKLYRQLLGEIEQKDFLILPYEDPNAYHIYNQFVIRVPSGRRDALKKYLDEKNIGNMIYYPTPLHLQPCFAYLGHKKGDFPESEKACSEVLALPIHSHITPSEIEQVASAIKAYFL